MRTIRLLSALIILFSITSLYAEILDDKALLLKLYSEEKMAYDLFGEFYDRWQLNVFNDVQQREARHVWCVEVIMNKYSAAISAGKKKILYHDKDTESLYNELSVKGCISDLSALEAAAFLKEKFISDLRTRALNINDGYLLKVIFLLEKAAKSHFKAFVKSIRLSGSEYIPVYLTGDEFSNIMAADKNIAGN